uniref:Calponin-homology (CH) domain-containing protein n=1 Tax=Caenorhabditis tropicalis TaxID=1561998 RepID=A0A1I7TZ18_9PELO
MECAIPNMSKVQGYTVNSSVQEDVRHTISNEEVQAYASYINGTFGNDKDLAHHLPIQTTGGDLFKKVGDGWIFCKLINRAVEGTIDERAMKKKNLNAISKLDNLTLVCRSAQGVGISLVNNGPTDMAAGTPHLVLAFLFKLIKKVLLAPINLNMCRGLQNLLQDEESLADLQRISPEDLLIRWVNYQMSQAGCHRKISNFSADITDSEVYSILLHQIAPPQFGVNLEALRLTEKTDRASKMLEEAAKINVDNFVTAAQVVGGHSWLNLAFVANVFNKFPGFPEVENKGQVEQIQLETREEKMYRHFLNSLGVSPQITHLYDGIKNGLVLLQALEVVSPGSVDWKKAIQKIPNRQKTFSSLINLNISIEAGRNLGFRLIGIDGKNLFDEDQTAVFSLLWQLMREYTIVTVRKAGQGKIVSDTKILSWANESLRSAGYSVELRSFKDKTLSDGKVILELLNWIKPGTVDMQLFEEGQSFETKMKNCRLAITLSRKIGAVIYALPEDIVECNSKMMLTVFAVLMSVAVQMA